PSALDRSGRKERPMRLAPALCLILLFPIRVWSAAPGYITQCFKSVLLRHRAILDADLSCPSFPGNTIPVIGLQDGSRLLLNGHTIEGGDIGVGSTGKRATIQGPGVIRGMVT